MANENENDKDERDAKAQLAEDRGERRLHYLVSFWMQWVGHHSIRTPGRVISACASFDHELNGDDTNALCVHAAASVRQSEQALDEHGRPVFGAQCNVVLIAASRIAAAPTKAMDELVAEMNARGRAALQAQGQNPLDES